MSELEFIWQEMVPTVPIATGENLFPLWDALRIVPIRSETVAPFPAIEAACLSLSGMRPSSS